MASPALAVIPGRHYLLLSPSSQVLPVPRACYPCPYSCPYSRGCCRCSYGPPIPAAAGGHNQCRPSLGGATAMQTAPRIYIVSVTELGFATMYLLHKARSFLQLVCSASFWTVGDREMTAYYPKCITTKILETRLCCPVF